MKAKMILDTPENMNFVLTTQNEIQVDASGPYYFYKVGQVRDSTAIAILSKEYAGKIINEYSIYGFRYFDQLIERGTDSLKFKASTPRVAVECAIRAGRVVYRADTFFDIVEICNSEEF